VASPVPSSVPTTATPPAASADAAAAAPETGSTGSGAGWIAALIAVGLVIAVSAPVAFLRRRKQRAESEPRRKEPKAAAPRRLVDPAAGIEVIESSFARPAPSFAVAAPIGAPQAPELVADVPAPDLTD